jgi:hypothetical protein
MRRAVILLAISTAVLALCAASVSGYSIPQSVVGSGGGRSSGPGNSIIGTVGQAAIGVVAGPANIHEIGFWYQPGWILTGVDDGLLLPNVFRLWQNEPNPFNPVTTIRFAVPRRTRVTMILYDIAGREVRTLVDDEFEPGYHRATVQASGLASGVYFCRMVAGDFVDSRKLILLK